MGILLNWKYRQITDRAVDQVPAIDGLRALAVLSVIFYHLNHDVLPGGFLGVDLFFVISGFVVSAAQDRRGRASRFIPFILDFYARRLRRILPALLVMLVVTGVFSAWFIPDAWLSDTNEKTGLYAFFGLSNWILAQTSEDYFSPRVAFNPYTHTWSLGVEEQFYLFFPFLFFWWSSRRWAGKSAVPSIAMYGVLAILSLLGAVWWAEKEPAMAWYLIFTRFWELAAGVLLYQFSAHCPGALANLTPVWRTAIAAGSSSLILAGWVVGDPQGVPWPWAFCTVLGTVGLLALLSSGESGWLVRGLSGPGLVFVGRISYSLYLWHWPIIVLLRWTSGMASWLDALVALTLTFLCATLSYRWIECPVRYSRALHRWPAVVTILLGAMAVGVGGAMSVLLAKQRGALSLSVTRDRAVWYPGDFNAAAVSRCPLHIENQSLEGGIFLHRMVPQCGDQVRNPRLFVAGDSHAGAYLPLLQRFSAENSVELLVYMRGGCTYINLAYRNDEAAHCRSFARVIVDDVQRRVQPGDGFFLPSLRLVRLTGQWDVLPEETVQAAMSEPEALQKRIQALDEALALLQPLAVRGMHIIFEAPKPLFRAPPFRCSDWFNRGNPICRHGLEMSRRELLEYRQPVMESFAEIARRMPGLQVWDPFPVLCPQETCVAMAPDGKPLFFDGDHLSGYGNQVLYEDFRAFMLRQRVPSGAPD